MPQFLARAGIPGVGIQVTGQFPGSEQFLGAGYVSGFLTAVVTAGGRTASGVFLYGAGAFDTGVDGAYANYVSYAVVNQGADPRIGAALLRTWATWDPSRDQAAAAQRGAQLDPHHQRRRRPDRPGRVRRGGRASGASIFASDGRAA